ncbi:replicative helicase loader/inhibitor [Cohnella yongneupensis]|uniref:Replicative helicase loader/inhibitor n=1 Tax=Cohnella yongneupensis TaxID=425006 RepID=A0ABW0QTW2_9BACL
MKATETLKIIALISTAYPNHKWTEEQSELWTRMLSAVPFEVAQRNCLEHVLGSRFPPTIADIARIEQQDNPDKLLAETSAKLAEIDQADRLAIDCPPHLVPRFLNSGVSD